MPQATGRRAGSFPPFCRNFDESSLIALFSLNINQLAEFGWPCVEPKVSTPLHWRCIMSPVKIHGFPQSTYVRTACMACCEKGVAYEVVPLAFREPAHAALHPFLRMPAMEYGTVTLFETLAIAGYIDEAFEGRSLQPNEPADHARMRQWISAGIDYLYDDLVGAGFSGDDVTDDALETAAKDLTILDGALSGSPYLAGQTMSLADLFMAPMIAYGCTSGKAAAMVDARPNLAKWRDRMFARDSFIATQA